MLVSTSLIHCVTVSLMKSINSMRSPCSVPILVLWAMIAKPMVTHLCFLSIIYLPGRFVWWQWLLDPKLYYSRSSICLPHCCFCSIVCFGQLWSKLHSAWAYHPDKTNKRSSDVTVAGAICTRKYTYTHTHAQNACREFMITWEVTDGGNLTGTCNQFFYCDTQHRLVNSVMLSLLEFSMQCARARKKCCPANSTSSEDKRKAAIGSAHWRWQPKNEVIRTCVCVYVCRIRSLFYQ